MVLLIPFLPTTFKGSNGCDDGGHSGHVSAVISCHMIGKPPIASMHQELEVSCWLLGIDRLSAWPIFTFFKVSVSNVPILLQRGCTGALPRYHSLERTVNFLVMTTDAAKQSLGCYYKQWERTSLKNPKYLKTQILAF